ncbi:MipA/OmpV family protein [Shewanella amazonensis]|uniref:MltA-interacting MipA n=1 Tax=Shewanella amazonensis (strain ATCC BAA-1098 / SB2B) TaxID=326297 RepID=A1S1V8_SHEAM|nr:MipA/OmpV family protein [Shewanella amazonensis]ABL98364.1 hypothetical protein Sama_0152 [Shewanella amazonensis SB2B]
MRKINILKNPFCHVRIAHGINICRAILLGLGLLFCSVIDAGELAEDIYTEDEGWHLGVAIGYGTVTNPLYNKRNIPLYLVPKVEYFNGDFAWTNTQLSWTPIQSAWGNLALISQFNEDGLYFFDNRYNAGMLLPLARPPQSPNTGGVVPVDTSVRRGDISQIADRKLSYMAGASWTLNLESWHFSFLAVTDVTGVHEGFEAFGRGEYLLQWGSHQFALGGELQYQNDQLVDYYYGTRLQDRIKGFSRYETDYSLNSALKLRYQYHWTDSLRLISDFRYQWLGSSISDSPLVEDKAVVSAFIGVAWGF